MIVMTEGSVDVRFVSWIWMLLRIESMYGSHFVAKRDIRLDCEGQVEGDVAETVGIFDPHLICGATDVSQDGCHVCQFDQSPYVKGTGDATTADAQARRMI